LIDFVFFFEI